MNWPRNAHPGQLVVALVNCEDGSGRLEKGKIYTVEEIRFVDFPTANNVMYIKLAEISTHLTRYDTLKPVDPMRINQFKRILTDVALESV